MQSDGVLLSSKCQFVIGEQFQRELVFNANSIRDFATVSGDTNPLHHDEDYARSSRFGGLIACGGHSIAMMMGALGDYLTMKGDALGLEFSFRLLKAVPEDSKLDLTWIITNIEPKLSLHGHILFLEGQLTDSKKTVFVSATCKSLALAKGQLANVTENVVSG